MPIITVRARCYPTEDPEKVKRAIYNIFPESTLMESEDGFVANATSVEKLSELIRNMKILDSARAVLLRGREGNMVKFRINKQVAFVGKLSFIEDRDPPLGSIEVVIEDENITGLIDTIAPSTVGGEG
ncbi:MAG: RNA-binding domain-containing protein [Methanomassiliicoccales archaeon]|jgi:predicted RNA binding protein with dsRBD fold (UPF0201 family)|nr:RNA-binding domain-containing protein [Methanomassiliicoccales archaeon]